MLWVGGHIFLVSLYEIGGHDGLLEGTWLGDVLHAPYDVVHHWEVAVHDAVGGALGSLAGWLVNTLASAVVGLVVGLRSCWSVLRAFGVGGGHGSAGARGGHADGHARRSQAGRAPRGPRRGFSESVSPVLRF